MDIALLLLALLGHTALWVAAVNRIHAMGWPKPIIQVLTAACFGLLAPMPVGVAATLWRLGLLETVGLGRSQLAAWFGPIGPVAQFYLAFCWVAGVVITARWVRRHLLDRPPGILRLHRRRSAATAVVALAALEHPHHFLVHLPRNQSLELDLTERVIDVPRLPPDLDGLTIVHISDLHFTGRIGRPYFEEIVRHSNALEPDLVAVTGDLVDRPECIDWVPDTLGRLTARFGVYFVLGNHDRQVDTGRLLRVLDGCGLVHLGGRWIDVPVRSRRVVLAGNEMPWFGRAADLADCPPRDVAPLRILLSHTPDQLDWARNSDADLLLAGHTHGGQIRLPGIGPIFAPSRNGVTYASGLFHSPPTIMHVSRGVSGQLPLRLNCAPEITELRLCARGQ